MYLCVCESGGVCVCVCVLKIIHSIRTPPARLQFMSDRQTIGMLRLERRPPRVADDILGELLGVVLLL